jgi:Na+-translocating ferredoxin:NAD+ oxidoreductase RnfG subunit
LVDVSSSSNNGTEKFLNKLIGGTEVEDALVRLDMLTKEETAMTMATNLVVTHDVDGNVKVVEEVTRGIKENVKIVEKVIRGIDDNAKVAGKVIYGIDDNVRAIKDGAQGSLNLFVCASTNFQLISMNRNG